MFNKYGLLLVTSISLSCQVAFAGGDGSEFDTLAAELAESSSKTNSSNAKDALNKEDTISSGSEGKSNDAGKGSGVTTKSDSITTSDAFKQKSETASSESAPSSRGTGFDAIEDEQLVIDTSNIQDGDGIGNTQIQWQISENGDEWRIVPGAITPTFTPRDQHVNKYLRVQVSYVDGQGNSEVIISPSPSAVKNVNDKPTGSARLIGTPVEDSALVVDTSSISDEDGIGGFEISWQRSSSQSDWEAFPSEKTEVLRLQQEHVNYSFRAVVSYVDSHGTREVLYTSPSESIDNLDDPVQGDVTINGLPREGSVLKAISNSLSDEDGIASINISWEKSKDGRNWIALNSVSGPSLNLNQDLVGFQIRTRVAVVDNFGIETNLYSLATRTVENVNNKPSGRIIIRRVGQ